MLQTWRWFGPDDPVSLENVRQAGAVGVVSALHHMNRGEVWSEDEVLKRRAEIERAGLVWSVVESINVGEAIKTRSGDFRAKIDNHKQSIRNAARAGVKTFCYNFMAITDWTRTNLNWPLPGGGTALRFDAVDYAAYDVFILRRDGAEGDYAPERIAAARARFQAMTPHEMGELERTLIDWLPARDFTYDRQSFKRALAAYKDVAVEDLRANLVAFVREIAATAEEEGARLAIHPDDPAFPIFGLPRVMSTAEDVRKLFAAAPSQANGITLCAGSFGSNPRNDLVAMAREFGPRDAFRPFAQCQARAGRLVLRGRSSRGRDRHGPPRRGADGRGGPPPRGRPPRRRDPDAPRPRALARRRRQEARQPRLFVHRPPQGPGRAAWRDADGRGVPEPGGWREVSNRSGELEPAFLVGSSPTPALA